MRGRRWLALAQALLALAMLGTACGSSDSSAGDGDGGTPAAREDGAAATRPDAGPDQEIVSAFTSDVATMDPQKVSDFGRDMLLWRVYEELVSFDKEGNPVPNLAAALPERVDDTTWEVELVPDVKFSNGAPFTADDAVYSVNRMVDPKYETLYTETATITGASKVDELTLRITTDGPDPIFLRRLKTIKMLSKDHGDIEKEPLGTGPYMLEEFTPGTGGTIVYNPEYRGDKPQVIKVTYRVIPDANTRVQALQSGEVDIVPNIPPDQVDSAPKVVAAPKPSGSAYFRLNEVSGPFEDVRLRQAVNYAIDREALVKALFNDGEYAVPATCQGAPQHSEGANQSLVPHPFDIEQAKALVEEAGATGMPIDIAAVSGTYAQDRNAAQVVAQSIEAIGLKPNLSIENYNAWFKKIYAVQGDAPHMTFAETTNNLGHVARQTALLYSSEGSVSAYNDPEMDALLKTASTELDDAKRQDAYDAVMQKGCDDALAIFLYDRRDIYGMTDRIVFEPGIELPPRLNYDEIQVVGP